MLLYSLKPPACVRYRVNSKFRFKAPRSKQLSESRSESGNVPQPPVKSAFCLKYNERKIRARKNFRNCRPIRQETIKVEDASFSHSILCTGACPSPLCPQLLLFLHTHRPRRRSFIRKSETITSI
ncbi:hypothetical protein L3Y34_000628 [Caenorhabditis briggsae]|uniref:Uncharacterized protein n=1 Tax=Caenorhabditis briggsae TaxID=6238 RepID=A0AAE9IPF1_CAEBR|nr:hypothetical protein L3Y34_000628 [Caenorhabditis briggsae]